MTLAEQGNIYMGGVTCQNTVMPDVLMPPAPWATLTDPQGNALAVTGAKIEAIEEMVAGIRPNVTAGDGDTSLTVTLIVRTEL